MRAADGETRPAGCSLAGPACVSRSRRACSSPFFPLPAQLGPQIPSRNFSRGVQQCVGRRAETIHDINSCVGGLNWMAGVRDAEKAHSGVRLYSVHPEVFGLIDQAVHDRGAPPFDSSPEEAAARFSMPRPATTLARRLSLPSRLVALLSRKITEGPHWSGMCSPNAAVSSSRVLKRRCCEAIPSFPNSRTMGVRSSHTWTAYWRNATGSMVFLKNLGGEV